MLIHLVIHTMLYTKLTTKIKRMYLSKKGTKRLYTYRFYVYIQLLNEIYYSALSPAMVKFGKWKVKQSYTPYNSSPT